ncbi:hypothetical protein NLY43_25640 [Mesorhizobium sp. C416B]|uniref:hypothetical protein n=1 Tax=unclassified Mesorhizobium TaxID=325217 RepID=UPI0003CE4534|nr:MULTISPECIES: hypothetical protein [unclassified Mesorhizobium]ESX49446.1 hypothetical protein X762_12445 [Mesorhizobium sp. LSHC426A00]ESX56236.1 hypothetical protein X761_12525 [Mesorhizobium sp. LSHC424B00]ESX73083.1 hypothetical protein X758_11855 [Mesorhizobium sp. LSHC416B00]ESZ42911.1 hypothetical protein X732_02085 [Mesorhizobium sp. L2C066B000]WJI61958.1 hypothetical protein NLY43_25640 [Mesorhizobium sp. C416B]
MEKKQNFHSFVLIPMLGSVGGEGSVLAAYPDMTAMQQIGHLLFEHIHPPSRRGTELPSRDPLTPTV